MSGGVDSSVAALLLKRAGHDPVGVTFRLYSSVSSRGQGCCAPSDIHDARRVAGVLGIPHYVLDLEEMFSEHVIRRFVSSYASGLTPNPCVRCNGEVRFDRLWRIARAAGAQKIATGHYARVEKIRPAGGGKEEWALRPSADPAKDQSYVLYRIGREMLSRVLFPVGDLPKSRVRDLARRAGLPVSEKPDSQEICFTEGPYRDWMRRNHPELLAPGPVLDEAGEEIGRHEGLPLYTVGQRRGLGLSHLSGGRPMYVKRLDPARNAVIVAEKDRMLCRGFLLRDPVWLAESELPLRCLAKARSHAPLREATVRPEGNHLRLIWSVPQPPSAPGQHVVLYDGYRVLGGAEITAVLW